MTTAPNRHTQVPCGNYEVAVTWSMHIERQRKRNEARAWSEPAPNTIPCEHCGWSCYLHEIADEVRRLALIKAREEATKKKLADK